MAGNNKKKKKDAAQVLNLEFDDGKVVECIIEGVFGVDGQDYIALVPEDDSGDVYIYKYIETGDGEYHFEDEADDEKFEAAVRFYEKLKGYKRSAKEN